MPRISVFAELERTEGKPIRQILVEKLNRLRTIEKLAQEIDVSVAYTSKKVSKLGIENRPHWVIKDGEDAE